MINSEYSQTAADYNPGSFNQFLEGKNFANHQEALSAYMGQISVFREKLAEEKGISVEDLREISA